MREEYVTYVPEREPYMSIVAEELDEFSNEENNDNEEQISND